MISLLVPSLLAHIAFGAFLAFFFVLYYINGDGKWKLLIEALLGTGGNIGIIFCLNKIFPVDDNTVKMYSIASCLITFLAATAVILGIVSHIIKEKDGNDVV